MPSTSKKQHNLMEAVAHNPGFAKKVGIPQSVGKDFSTADKGRKFKEGGQIMAKSQGVAPSAMGKVKTAAPSRDGIAEKGKTKGKQITMRGGKTAAMCGGGMAKGKK
jgi:hypothetical protein